MLRRLVSVAFAAVGVLGLDAAGALAQGGSPPPDATAGAVGITGVPLGAIEPVAAPATNWRSSS
jgi:hypothetical protein